MSASGASTFLTETMALSSLILFAVTVLTVLIASEFAVMAYVNINAAAMTIFFITKYVRVNG